MSATNEISELRIIFNGKGVNSYENNWGRHKVHHINSTCNDDHDKWGFC